ncbi:MAG: hypothetical protein ACXVDC_15805, partial [Bacteroidia bacterium]
MSFIKDISDLHINYKSCIVAMAIVMPFWYLSIYFEGRAFFNDSPIYIPIVASFCFSVLALSLSLVSLIINFFADNKRKTKKEQFDLATFLILTVCLAIFYQAFYNLIFYFIKTKFT